MTAITDTEIKILVIQVIFMAVIGVFMLLYSAAPITLTTAGTIATPNNTSIDASNEGWITGLISLPGGLGELTLITLLIVSPFLFFDIFIAIRYAKDIATNWI
jgi:hypothetical protein